VFQISAAPLPAAWGGGTFGAMLLLRDVTELDRVEQMRSDFVANASHELRTPIAAIRGAIETLISGPRTSRRCGTGCWRWRSRTPAAGGDDRDLLDLSRLEAPDVPLSLGPVDVPAAAAAVGAMFEDACRARQLSLAMEIDPGLAGARTDEKLLGLILRNLIENATKFAYDGTTIRVTAKRTGAAPRNRGGPDRMRLEVIDRGVGVPLHLQDRVFERYFQVDSARTGSSPGGARARGPGWAWRS